LTSLEIVIAVLVTLVAFSGYIDMSNIMNRVNVLSQNVGYVARVVGNQGGIRRNEIDNYAGTYVTSSQLYQNVKASMNHAGIKDGEWRVYIDNQRLTSTANLPVKDYGTKMDVKVVIDYDWTLTGNFVPVNMSGEKESTAQVYTTHKVRNAGYH